MINVLITGSRSGLGLALAKQLRNHVIDFNVIDYDFQDGFDVRKPDVSVLGDIERLDILVNCAGVNDIDWIENFDSERWDTVMDINAKGIFMMTRAFLPHLKLSREGGTVVNIVSNAAQMPMTCSSAYNASKGAAHILTLQLARELTRRFGITVFGIAPNKMKNTMMSGVIDDLVCKTRGWSMEEAQKYQLQSLLAGEETEPEAVADFIAFLLSSKSRHKFLTGTVIPYGA